MRRRRYLSICALTAVSTAAGCTNGGDGENGDGEEGMNNEIMVERVRGTLETEGAEIHELTDEGDVVTLEYSPGELSEGSDEAEIESRVEETIRAVSETYYEPIVGPGSGWRADRLDGSVVVDGTVVARYHLETAWADECSGTGDTAGCIEERVQASVERPHETDTSDGG